MPETLGFIGLGNMGVPIATNLLKAGYCLRVYNRAGSKASPLTSQGATKVSSPSDVAQPGGVVLSMLADDRAVEEVCSASPSFVQALGPGGVHISISTIAPATARRLAEHHAKYKVGYVASPVFGRPTAAQAKQLWVCLSGASGPKERAQPILTAIGQALFDFGEDPGAANVVKLCGNFLIASAIEALGEALTLAQKNGLDKTQVAEMFGKTMFACTAYQNYGKQIAAEQFAPANFRLALGLKDLNLAIETASSCSMPMPLASLLRDRWIASVAKGRADMDWAAAAIDIAEEAGLK
jgi:3-hydroxyisobutyrate dehydrogenase-like beta-hydroxyacid dehydrogenase